MKLKPLVAVMPVMFAMLTGCHTMDYSSNNDDFSSVFMHPMRAPATVGNTLENCMELDKAEIRVAKLAKMKTACPMVKRYSAMIVRDHEQNLKAVHRLSREIHVAPTMNADADRMREKSAQRYAKLEMLNGQAFDKEYIESMIHCHHKILAYLDRAIANSTHPKLTAYLKSTQAAVNKHLHEAEELKLKCMH